MATTPTKRWEVDKIILTDHRTGKEYIIPLFEERATKRKTTAKPKKKAAAKKKEKKREPKSDKTRAKAAKKPKAAKGTGKRTARTK